MSISEATATELQSSLRALSLWNNSPVKDIPRPAVKKPATTKAAHPNKKTPVVADSWEDEADDSEPEINSPGCASSSLSPSITIAESPLDPPPTPISPQTSQIWSSTPVYPDVGGGSSRASDSKSPTPSRRPEKQTAVAGRMIAGALGLRAPKRTEDQRAYDRAMKEKEIRRRNQEREAAAKAKEEEERAKAAVWDD
ncbi:hypothetical protein BDV28DRAFT_146026 [Aspergillus coremiiformis]|uniref:Uncharacterized protein n=1 Tax=Aspergillus coremiiformis TaxID=138285 RepID=A0A5N6ZD53_9EURO|nr:hypothetical protein BDV28DRAFT_146026 [Aspergillus coremiiformis]